MVSRPGSGYAARGKPDGSRPHTSHPRLTTMLGHQPNVADGSAECVAGVTSGRERTSSATPGGVRPCPPAIGAVLVAGFVIADRHRRASRLRPGRTPRSLGLDHVRRAVADAAGRAGAARCSPRSSCAGCSAARWPSRSPEKGVYWCPSGRPAKGEWFDWDEVTAIEFHSSEGERRPGRGRAARIRAGARRPPATGLHPARRLAHRPAAARPRSAGVRPRRRGHRRLARLGGTRTRGRRTREAGCRRSARAVP